MPDATEQQAIADLARQVVADVAPREVPLFRPLSQAYFKDPEKTLKGGGGADRMLGFGGMNAVGILMTPMILQSTQVALTSLVGGMVRQVDSELQRMQSWLTDLQAKPAALPPLDVTPATAPDAPVAPSSELVDQMKGVVAQQLAQLKCPPDQQDVLTAKICSALLDGTIAEQMLERSCPIARQVQQLKIEIDELKKARDVKEIVESEYFDRVYERANELRRQSPRA
jgi:hypothetical protein